MPIRVAFLAFALVAIASALFLWLRDPALGLYAAYALSLHPRRQRLRER